MAAAKKRDTGRRGAGQRQHGGAHVLRNDAAATGSDAKGGGCEAVGVQADHKAAGAGVCGGVSAVGGNVAVVISLRCGVRHASVQEGERHSTHDEGEGEEGGGGGGGRRQDYAGREGVGCGGQRIRRVTHAQHEGGGGRSRGYEQDGAGACY